MNDGDKPSAKAVEDFHTNSDLDTRPGSQHHTLGPGGNQAAPGNHTHDGGSSPQILAGYVITGSRGSDAWRQSVNALLVRLGAKDNSTA